MKKFSVIITHYNQMGYIKEAIDSIINQTYRNIELIIADDGSKTFDKKKIDKYIKNKNKKHYEYKILDSKENLGTVKNLNNAIKHTTGDYILFFAADDKLYDENVINNFVLEFEDNDKRIITTQCLLYDVNLKKRYGKFVNKYKALLLNKKSSRDMYAKMAIGCCYGSGGTAYKKEIFEKYGLFDEQYLFVEDWSYWLKILRKEEKMYYCNFNTLCHRDGGISHSEFSQYTIPKHVRQYYFDILNIYQNEIFPYFDRFKFIEKYKILCQYYETTTYYARFVPETINYLQSYEQLKNSDKKFKLFWKITLIFRNFDKFIIDRIKILLKFNKIVVFTFFMWLLINIFIINNFSIKNFNLLFLIYIINYFLCYGISHIIYNSIKFIKNRKTGGLHVQ